MGISVFNKIKDFGSELFDLVLGAEHPKVYYDPQGQIKDVLEKLTPVSYTHLTLPTKLL